MKVEFKRCFLLLGLLFCSPLVNIYAQCSSSFNTTPSNHEICDNQSVQFTLTSSSVITQRIWNFGDGSAVSGSSNPSHVFTSTKDTTYTISLIVKCSNGQRDTSTVDIKVFSRPNADFSISKSSLCSINDSSCFTNISANAAGTTYLWDFGDLVISTDYSTCHTYYTSGDFDVELRAIRPSNQGGCQQKIIKTISVKETPNPDFDLTPSSGCLPFVTTITNYTSSRSNIVDWAWEFGDGTTFTGPDPGPKAYSTAGTYVVKLSTSNITGCKNFTSLPVFVSNAPTLSLNTPPNICPNIPITVTAISNAVNAFYSWNTSGGQVISRGDTNYIVVKWATGGIKNISVDVDQNGCVVSASTAGYVYQETNLRANYPNGNSVCAGGSVEVRALPDLLPLYTFYKGNNIISATSISGITLTNLQVDSSLSVRITDANNCTFYANISAIAKPNPVLTVTSLPSTTICPGTNTTISAFPAGLNNYTFLLNYSFVQSGTGANFSKANFIDNDKVQVIGTKAGCSDTASITINVIDSLGTQLPVVNCGTSTVNSVEFVWNSVAGASFYKVSVDNGAYINPSTGSNGLSHQVTGLSEAQNVTIRVMIVRTNPCADTVVSQVLTCTAINCAGIKFKLKYDSLFCTGDNIVITATGISGVTPSYLFNWNGLITPNPIYSIEAKDVLTVPGKVLEVSLSDPTLSPCPSYKQLTYGLEVITIPALNLMYSHVTTKCQFQDQISLRSYPNNLDSYEYRLDDSLLSDTRPYTDIFVKDTLIHTITGRARLKNCYGPYSTVTFKGINFPTYKVIMKTAGGNQYANTITGITNALIPVCAKNSLIVNAKTQFYLQEDNGTETAYVKFDSSFFYANYLQPPYYAGTDSVSQYTGSLENVVLSSILSYKGCHYASDNSLNIMAAQSPAPPEFKPGFKFTGALNGEAEADGLFERTCAYNKFYYKIFPQLDSIVWEVVKDTTTIPLENIERDSDFSFYATVPAVTNSKAVDTTLYLQAQQMLADAQNDSLSSYISEFTSKYSAIPGITTSDLNKKAKKSADSLVFVSVDKSFTKVLSPYTQATIDLKFTNMANGCSTFVHINPRQGLYFHSFIEGENESCYSNTDLNLNYASLNLTQPNDTLTFTLSTSLASQPLRKHPEGGYVQELKTIPGIAAPPYTTTETYIYNYQSLKDTVKVLPPFTFKGYYPAEHDITITNKKGCSMSYKFITTAKTTDMKPKNIEMRLCVNDEMDGVKIIDTTNTDHSLWRYNYWDHPYVTKDTINNKYIFKPDKMIENYKSYIVSCEVSDTSGSCCVANEIEGCIIDCDEFQYIPNAISPNGDNINDKWKIYGLRNPKVEVFNRWGELVYHSERYMNDWEGKAVNGQPFPDGVYFYIVYPSGSFTKNTQTTQHLLEISSEEYIKQNQSNNTQTGAIPDPNSTVDPTTTVSYQLPNYDQLPDVKHLDPKTRISYYFCEKVSFKELRGTLIIQR